MQQMLRMRGDKNVDRIKQALEIAFRYERSAEVRHDEIADEHHALIRQVDEHGVVSFASPDRDDFDVCTPDLQLGAGRDGKVWFEAAHILNVEALTEKRSVENPRC